MASPKMCLDCDRVTWLRVGEAVERGWVNLFWDSWNDLWRCPACCDSRGNR
jgi:hypothetical protein